MASTGIKMTVTEEEFSTLLMSLSRTTRANRYCDCGEMITNGSDKCLGCYLKEA